MTNTFELSIETVPGKSERHGFHLGTIEPIARKSLKRNFTHAANMAIRQSPLP